MASPCAKSKRGVALFNRERADRVANGWHEPAVTRQAYPGLVGEVVVALGMNGPPTGFACTGSEACRRDCAKLCLHAEQRALWAAGALDDVGDLELVHVKVVDGIVVPGGGPSCWQCSRLIAEVGLRGVWLLEAETIYKHRMGDEQIHRLGPRNWQFYSANEFHRATIRSCELGDDRFGGR